jgi:asparagine synthase (glutamine-hydrolysing)
VTFTGCGIAGVLHATATSGRHPGVREVRAMTGALAHRGPDSEAIWEGPGVILGHRRLAITGPGEAGSQPMTRGHLTITYNGEAYNYRSLRQQLRSRYLFTTGTDTEVVLRAWQHWGPAALNRLNGMYAFAIWDNRARTLTLARDRIGIKPLYYYRGNGFTVFASETEALLTCPQIPRRPDIETLARHLLLSSALQPGRCRTLVDGITALPPATCLTLHADGRQRTVTYWELPQPPGPPRTEPELAAELSGLIARSVREMAAADVEVAAFLSGGLDSSAIAAHAASGSDLTAITLTYPRSKDDDLRYSRMLVQHCQPRVRHHVIARASASAIADIDAAGDLAAICDDPRHPAILANYQAVHDLGLRAVLNGQGADELMAGYAGLPAYAGLIRAAISGGAPDITALPASRQPPGLSTQVLARRSQAHFELRTYHDSLPGPPLERLHRLLLAAQVARIVQFEDFLSMRASVEARFPFLDHRIAEWCFTVPYTLHLQPGARQGKALLRQALHGILPTYLLRRPKQVFPHPGEAGLRASLAATATACHAELHDDPLLPELFDIPPDRDLPALPARTLWLLLATWRWHHRLQSAPVMAGRPLLPASAYRESGGDR